MLIAFMGQSIAGNVLSYTMVSCNHQSMQSNMAMMSHEDMTHTGMMTEQGSTQIAIMDCCQEQCECPMNGCVNLSVLSNINFNVNVIVEHKILQLALSHQSRVNTSLYLPPLS